MLSVASPNGHLGECESRRRRVLRNSWFRLRDDRGWLSADTQDRVGLAVWGWIGTGPQLQKLIEKRPDLCGMQIVNVTEEKHAHVAWKAP